MKISNYYKGNQFLPKAGVRKELTLEQKEEFLKCARDPIYFGNTYFQLVHQDHGLIPMKLYNYQNEALEIFQKKGKLIMATARQVGKTSLATVIILHAAIFNKHKNIALLANRKATAMEVLDRIQIAYEMLPGWLKGGVKEWNKSSVTFESGSKIFADATSGNSIRGKSIYLLYIDEAAFVENWDDFAAAVLPTVSANKSSKMIFTSTPNGLNHFFQYCESARTGTSEFGYIEVPWWKVDGRDEEWKLKTLGEMNFDEQRFAQEQEVEFQGSSGTLISGATLKRLKHINPYNQDNGLNMYKQVDGNHQYALIADTSRGKGLDYSAFHVIDITDVPYQQVCTFRNNMINTTDYAAMIDKISRYYNHAHILVELNDLGAQVADLLYDSHESEQLLMTESKGRAGKQISAGFGKKVERGITTSIGVKATGCAMIKAIIEQNKLILHDKETIEELKVFSQKGKSYEAEAGKHDDLAMGLVLFGWLSDQDYFKQITETDILEHLRERTESDLEDMLLPFGIVNNGLDDLIEEDSLDTMVSYDMFTEWMMN